MYEILHDDPDGKGEKVTWSLPYSWDEAEARRMLRAIRTEYPDAELIVHRREAVV